MKKQITCIKNRVEWINELLEALREIYRGNKDKRLQDLYHDIGFHNSQIGYYAKELEYEI